ncbi:MAG TPA: thiamine-phosphate kinase [Solirubrobacterales bacterium]|nr:thiamine-phosphate kinase [Solirubrobacterales bacterium]
MGEFELLARIRERLPASGSRTHLGSGDDAAVTAPDGATATSVDALVDGVHFRRDQASPAQIGHKALAAALSDLAAMGAEAGEAYVVLGLPPDFGEEECLELLDGMVALARQTGTDLAGGDLTRSDQLFLAITVVGHAPSPDAFLSRRGAHPGDALVLTGEIGGAAAGLLLLQNTDWSIDPSIRWSKDQSTSSWADALRARQLEPTPRLGAGKALSQAGATAMIDLSDGLGADAGHIARASGVKLEIEAEAVSLAPGAVALSEAAGRDPWRLLSGGEDYELLACVPPDRLEEATAAVLDKEGTPLTRIGQVQAGSGVEVRLPGGRLLEPAGFDQLA